MRTSADFLPDFKGVWDLAKIGGILYLSGIFVTFIYFTQFHILSVDLLKTNAIVLGVYVWIYADILPRILLLLVNQFKTPRRLYFALLVIVAYSLLQWAAFETFDLRTVLFALLASGIVICYFFGPGGANEPDAVAHAEGTTPSGGKPKSVLSKNLLAGPQAITRIGFFVFFLASVFAVGIYPNIPQYAGGGQPMLVRVQIKPEDTLVLKSRFIPDSLDKENCFYRDLLYESDKDYYFIENVRDKHTHLLFEIRIHKIEKELIRKIIFTKPNWLTY